MFDILITGKIVDPIDGLYEGSIVIKGERIFEVSDKKLDIEAKKKINLDYDSLIFPGFIDSHVHIREQGWSHKEDFLTGSRAAVNGGVTTIADMPNLPRPTNSKPEIMGKRNLASKSIVDVLFFGGVTNYKDAKEIQDFVHAYKIYTNESTGIKDVNWDLVEEAAAIVGKLNKPVTFHAEDNEIIKRNEERSKDIVKEHAEIRSERSEAIAVEKVAALAKKHKLKANIAHLSTRDALKIVRENKITCEVAPHHIYFNKSQMKNSFLKMNPPLRSEESRRSLLWGIRNEYVYMLATDHAPHTEEEKKTSAPSGVTGLDTYGDIVAWLLREQKIDEKIIAKLTSFNPSQFFSLHDRARIKRNYLADLAIIELKPKKVEKLYTKCQWSPYLGKKFPGYVNYTIKKGKILKNDGVVT